MLQCCGSDEDELTVLEFFAVGKTARALLCHAVKGGGRCQKRTYLQFSRFQWSRFLWLRFFIGYFTLPLSPPLLPANHLPPSPSHRHNQKTAAAALTPRVGLWLRSPGLEIWKCSACDYRRTAQGTMSDGCRAVRKQPLPHHARRSESRRTLSPVLSECGVSTHSISPGTAAEATAPRAA